ncbi:DUF5694 domain-containing protein [Sporosarcina oncorhynchi]|uniref:DUF5694 domain-containing protein n=1 Tax=Sporosarcina oncorhynchi TaxID=3056444 RepID=A0ABZ0L785_9BACL|nr:DUF5694 domain-containing protein [Sporosarcina sp. T2O-4]WOV87522.1 DUF5694 domain-containing protein [Sporosarcina sp. T2O-4]
MMQRETIAKPKLMIMGSFHMGPTGDLVQTEADDMLAPHRQHEIIDVVNHLKAFQPTKIAVEAEKTSSDIVNDQYRKYLVGDYQLIANEIDQIGYRLARDMNHEEIHAVDWMEKGAAKRDIGEVTEWAKANQPALYEELFGWYDEVDLSTKGRTVLEIILYYNQTEMVEKMHRVYVNTARIKEGNDYVGMDWLLWWYQRNLILFANLSDLAKFEEDRILFIVGASHVEIVANFARESGLFELVDVREYLQ